MSHRIEQLAMRRHQLLLRSERLRAELSADHRVMLDALGGIDRIIGWARRLASPVLLAGGAALLLRVLRRSRRAGFARAGFAMRGLGWVSLARRLLTMLTLVRAVIRSRRPPEPQSQF